MNMQPAPGTQRLRKNFATYLGRKGISLKSIAHSYTDRKTHQGYYSADLCAVFNWWQAGSVGSMPPIDWDAGKETVTAQVTNAEGQSNAVMITKAVVEEKGIERTHREIRSQTKTEADEKSETKIHRTIEEKPDGTKITTEDEEIKRHRKETIMELKHVLETSIKSYTKRIAKTEFQLITTRWQTYTSYLAMDQGQVYRNLPNEGLFKYLDLPLAEALPLFEKEFRELHIKLEEEVTWGEDWQICHWLSFSPHATGTRLTERAAYVRKHYPHLARLYETAAHQTTVAMKNLKKDTDVFEKMTTSGINKSVLNRLRNDPAAFEIYKKNYPALQRKFLDKGDGVIRRGPELFEFIKRFPAPGELKSIFGSKSVNLDNRTLEGIEKTPSLCGFKPEDIQRFFGGEADTLRHRLETIQAMEKGEMDTLLSYAASIHTRIRVARAGGIPEDLKTLKFSHASGIRPYNFLENLFAFEPAQIYDTRGKLSINSDILIHGMVVIDDEKNQVVDLQLDARLFMAIFPDGHSRRRLIENVEELCDIRAKKQIVSNGYEPTRVVVPKYERTPAQTIPLRLLKEPEFAHVRDKIQETEDNELRSRKRQREEQSTTSAMRAAEDAMNALVNGGFTKQQSDNLLDRLCALDNDPNVPLNWTPAAAGAGIRF